MTPRARLLTTMRGEKADMVPLVIAGFDFDSKDAIESHPDPHHRDIARAVYDETTRYHLVPSYINRYLATPPQFTQTRTEKRPGGSKRHITTLATPKGELTAVNDFDPISGTAWMVKYPVETMDDIDRIASIPWELPIDLKAPDSQDLPAAVDPRTVSRTFISSPLVCVAGMMRYEWFLELALVESKLIAELTEMCRVRILDVLTVLFSKPGIECVQLGGSEWVTPPMGSPAIYDALVQEQERSIIDYIHSNSDAMVHVHCHGRFRHALQRTIERGVDYTEPVEAPPDGDITMAEAKELASGRITLGGNVQCRILVNETEDAVEKAVRAAFEGGNLRFVLRPTEAASPRIMEREYKNYLRMIELWRELGEIA